MRQCTYFKVQQVKRRPACAVQAYCIAIFKRMTIIHHRISDGDIC